MSKAHSNKGRYFRFNNGEELERFVLLYKHLFTPYSEDVLKYERNWYKGNISDIEQGFERIFWNNEPVIKVNLTKENLDKILEGSRCFRKERFGDFHHRFIYVFE